MVDLLKFVLSSPFKFLGFFMILLVIAVLIEGAICNICKAILYSKKIKYRNNIDCDNIELEGKISSSINLDKE